MRGIERSAQNRCRCIFERIARWRCDGHHQSALDKSLKSDPTGKDDARYSHRALCEYMKLKDMPIGEKK